MVCTVRQFLPLGKQNTKRYQVCRFHGVVFTASCVCSVPQEQEEARSSEHAELVQRVVQLREEVRQA